MFEHRMVQYSRQPHQLDDKMMLQNGCGRRGIAKPTINN